MVESAKVGNFQGPPVTIERRRARELDAAVVRTEVRTTVTRRAELPVLVRATASWGAGALAVAVAGLAAIFVAALLADGLCAELFFFFFVVVVGVPDNSKPESSNAAKKFEKRRMLRQRDDRHPQWRKVTQV